jgi:signal peptidase I
MAAKDKKQKSLRKTPASAASPLMNAIVIGLPSLCFLLFMLSRKTSKAMGASDWVLTAVIFGIFLYFVSSMKPPKPNLWTVAGGVIAVIGTAIFIIANRTVPPDDLWWYTGVIVLAGGAVLWFLSGLPREQALEWVRSGLVALSLALVIRWGVAEPYRIPSSSMEPTLYGDDRIGRGDRVFVNKWIYGLRYPFMNKRIWRGKEPERWDIVVFKSAEKNADHPTLVKRIAGLPGERVLIRNGSVYINGEPLEIPDFMPEDQQYYAVPPPPVSQAMLERVRNRIYDRHKPMLYGVIADDEFSLIPEDHYFLLGDNSMNSRDGRYFGWMPNENLVGRVACIWWWPNHWRDFTGFSKTWWWRMLAGLTGLLLITRLFLGRSHGLYAPGPKRRIDHVFISFISYGLRLPFTGIWLLRRGRPQRGDLVLYYPESPDLPPGAGLMGRIAGLPGERVAFEEGRLFINGKPIETPRALSEENFTVSLPEAKYGRGTAKEFTLVPENQYFILTEKADEDEIHDSRTLGWQPLERIHGRASAVWWPPWRWRRINPCE